MTGKYPIHTGMQHSVSYPSLYKYLKKKLPKKKFFGIKKLFFTKEILFN